MARYAEAIWEPILIHDGREFGDGPFRIVHMTTEGPTYAAARTRYGLTGVAPHFTVDEHGVYQRVDTSSAANALTEAAGIETNRHAAVQIAIVGFAGRPKNRAALRNLARLCRWIESAHAVPAVWPSGFPLPASNGRDPGRHNRNPVNWLNSGGHFGRCHVPGNAGWDPAYTIAESQIVMQSEAATAPSAITPVTVRLAYGF